MKFRYLFLACLFIGFSIQAQRSCGYDEYREKLLRNPEVRLRMEQAELDFNDEVQDDDRLRLLKTTSSGTPIIPVVVHILYNNAAQNLSDIQIKSQIDVLNEDFRRLNEDFGNTPSVFKSLGADFGIQFELADTDPSGNPTNGIVRKTISPSFVIDINSSDFASDANGGSDSWDTTSYLNIWVGPTSSGLLGFASPPFYAGDPDDGVVINYTAFGLGATSMYYNLGRTTTHEVGHYFNLQHLWGLDLDNFTCTEDDLVSDTPIQKGPSIAVPSFPVLSGSTYCPQSGSNGPMFMNYMDYTDDVGMHLFTQGQKTRSINALNGPRNSLLSSDGLNNCTLTSYYQDRDGDGLGDPLLGIERCQPPVIAGYVTNNLDTNDIENETGETVYPNPLGSGGLLNDRTFVINEAAEIIEEVQLYDRHGKLIYNSKPGVATPIIELNIPLQGGVYFLVYSYDGKTKRKSILVK